MIVYGVDQLYGALPRGCSLTVGTFDGVHPGHQELIREANRCGRERGLPVGLLTFDRHPLEVIRPEAAPPLLTTLEQKLGLLDDLGLLDFVVVLPFDEARRNEAPDVFVHDVLAEQLGARSVVVGHDFRFGHRREGNTDLLASLGRQWGFDTTAVEPIRDPGSGKRISSTLLREALAAGDVTLMDELLGRSHEICGIARTDCDRERDAGSGRMTIEVDRRLCLPAGGAFRGWCSVGSDAPVAAVIEISERARRSTCRRAGDLTNEPGLPDRVTFRFAEPLHRQTTGRVSQSPAAETAPLMLELQRSA